MALFCHQFALHVTHNSPSMNTQDVLSNVPSPSCLHFYSPALYSHPQGLGSALGNHREMHTAICKRRLKAFRVFKLEHLQVLSHDNVDPSFNI